MGWVNLKRNKGIHSLLPFGKQGFRHFQEIRASSLTMVTWEEKHHHLQMSPPSSVFSLFLLLSTTSYSLGYPFGRLGSAAPAVSPPKFLCIPSLLAVGTVSEAEKVFMLFKHCSAIAKTSLCYQSIRTVLVTNLKCSTLWATMKKINYPSQNQYRWLQWSIMKQQQQIIFIACFPVTYISVLFCPGFLFFRKPGVLPLQVSRCNSLQN